MVKARFATTRIRDLHPAAAGAEFRVGFETDFGLVETLRTPALRSVAGRS